ncbi:MAG: HAMP domain-containing protein, partial [Candidatus Methylomirabilis sp.]
MSRSQASLAGLATLAIAASSLILWWLNRRFVLRPVQALVAGTRRVAEGDLSTIIPVRARGFAPRAAFVGQFQKPADPGRWEDRPASLLPKAMARVLLFDRTGLQSGACTTLPAIAAGRGVFDEPGPD